ncbi:hypothetical protein RDI58_017440 [Solanum bulbocastanum]|uniref:Response regulatory domain-containing protein n=1 Tax=Solanum bulbocastanum TaxID=147425 RepID=A0AAN8Y9Z2_SOLBU
MEVENSEKFRILVVDDDINCLLTTTASLKNLKFEVMTVNNIEVALGGLRSSGLSFDLLLTDVHMLKMDVFQFQREIAKEFDIHVAFMSNDEKDTTLMKGLDNGAVFFIVKPISQDNINYLWEYTTSLRKKKHTSKQVVQEFEENTNEKILNEVIYIESSSSVSERDKSTRKYDEAENEDGSSQPSKTSRIVWTDALHNKFLEAIAVLGVKKAHPRKILELMNIPELSRKHIASHLQKYRMSLGKNASPELILNSSKITPSNANQLSTTIDNISTLAPQLITENLNYADHDTETDLRGFMSDYEKDREFSNILSRHLNQKPCNLQGNHEGINDEEISLQLGNVLPNSELEQEIYGGVIAEEALFEHLYVPSNSEIEPGDYGSLTAEECSFFDSIILNHELEQANHEGLTTKEGLLQPRNDPPNTTLEEKCLQFLMSYFTVQQPDSISFIAEEYSFLHNIVPNHELQQQNYGSVTTQDDSFLLCYDHPDLELKVISHIHMFDHRAVHFENVIYSVKQKK